MNNNDIENPYGNVQNDPVNTQRPNIVNRVQQATADRKSVV